MLDGVRGAIRRAPRQALDPAILSLTVLALAASAPDRLAAQDPRPLSQSELVQARVHYVASCARCHGVEGLGGEGPPLARARLPRAPDDASLMRIISVGIPGTGMPRSRWLNEDELRLVAGYVRSLAPASGTPETLAGDPARGRALFEEEGCARCHTVGGFGTGRGPDLTEVGGRRGPGYLREAILDPGAALPRGQTAISSDFVDYLMVRVVDADGNETRGMRMNEDSYTIQLKDARGDLRSFYKPSLRELDKLFDRSLMRSYRDDLTDEEVDDLVRYLMTLTGTRERVIS